MSRDYLDIRNFLRVVQRLDWIARSGSAFLRAGVAAAVVLSLDALLVEGLPGWPWLGFAVGLSGTLLFWYFILLAIVTALRPLPLFGAARRVEEHRPEFESDLVSSLSLAPKREGDASAGASPSLVRALLGETREKLERLRPRSFVAWSPLRSWALRCAASAIAVFILLSSTTGLSPGALRPLVDPSCYWPLGKTVFSVAPGSGRMARGGELPVEVTVSGPRPGDLSLVYEEGGEKPVRVYMEQKEERLFTHSISGPRRAFRYRVATTAAASPWYAVEVVEPPTAGSFEVLYTYPAYTGLEPRRAEGNGSLETLRGTSVVVEFSANKPLRGGKALLGENEYEVEEVGERRYRSTFYLNGEGSYRLDLEDEEGFRSTDRLEYAIRYIEDTPPEVAIVEPQGEVDLGALSQIVVVFRATDDYGLDRLSIVYREPSGKEVKEQIVSGETRKNIEEEYYWDVGALAAQPGSLIPVFLEAVDNDTISGPKTSLSNSFLLKVPDPEVERRKTEESLDEFIDGLVDLLAEELDLLGRYGEQEESAEERWKEFSWEEAGENESLREKMKEMADESGERMTALEEQMYVDPMTRAESLYQLEMIGRQFEAMDRLTLDPMEELGRSMDPEGSLKEDVVQKSGFLKKYAEEAVATTEQMILMAEEMRREQEMGDVESSAGDMLDLQDDIFRSLENLTAEDREALEEVLASLDKMEDMLEDLMEALTKDNEMLPEEFLNSDALQQLPLDDLMAGIESIREKLRQGDIEGARQAAKELLKGIADLMNRLQQAGDDFENRADKAMEKLEKSTIPAMDKVIAEQKELLKQTEDLEEKVRERRDQDARHQDQGIPGGSRGGGTSGSGASSGAGSPAPSGAPSGSRAGGTSSPSGAPGGLSQGEQTRAGSLAGTETGLQGRTAGIADEAGALKASLPFLDPAIEGGLRGAADDMGSAAGLLGEGAPGPAVPAERSALAKLLEARSRAGQSLRALEQMQGYRQGKGGLSLRPGGRGPQAGGSLPSRGRNSGGRLGTDVRSFRIPGKEDYEVPRIFRQEILESLEEGYPAPYEERIRDYYHRIAE